MDSNMSEESRNRRREEALARRLSEALDEQASPRGPEPCPDPELIAAYRERELGPEEVAACEMHFAACSRCRKILAVLAASDNTPLAEKEVARLGELVAAAHMPQEEAPQGETIIIRRRPDWRVRWLAPAVGAWLGGPGRMVRDPAPLARDAARLNRNARSTGAQQRTVAAS